MDWQMHVYGDAAPDLQAVADRRKNTAACFPVE